MNNIQIAKIRNVKTPSRATSGSAGLDFFVPADIKVLDFIYLNDNVFYINGAHYEVEADSYDGETVNEIHIIERIIIPSGIKIKLPQDKSMLFVNKSGIAAKEGLIIGAQLVDNDYTGEIFFNLINTNLKRVPVIKAGQKLMQGIVIDTNAFCIEVVDKKDIYRNSSSERGEGSLGHSG